MNALDLVTKFVNGNDTVYHIFPTTMFVTKYPDNFDEEFEYIEKLPYKQKMCIRWCKRREWRARFPSK